MPGASQYVVFPGCARHDISETLLRRHLHRTGWRSDGPVARSPAARRFAEESVGFFDAGSVRDEAPVTCGTEAIRTTIGRRVPCGDPQNDSRRDGQNDAGRRPPPRRSFATTYPCHATISSRVVRVRNGRAWSPSDSVATCSRRASTSST